MGRIYGRRHQHDDAPRDDTRSTWLLANEHTQTLADCLIIDTAYMTWLLERQRKGDDVLDTSTLRLAWRTAWVEGIIHERFREPLPPLPEP